MNRAYLILGGNKGDKEHNLKRARQLIVEEAGVIEKSSAVFATAAWGNKNQPDFLNQVVCIQTPLLAGDLLKKAISIERQLGRVRGEEKWMERTMDIDILFYNDDVINTADLIVPHPFLHQRKFVLVPMVQLAPMLVHPVLKKNMEALLLECSDNLKVMQVF